MNAKKIRLANGLMAGAVITLATSLGSAAFAQDACVPYRNIQGIHMVDDMSAVVSTQRDTVLVTFRGICQVTAAGEFFVLDRFQLGQCVSPGDVFNSSGVSAPCTVVSVAPLPAALQNGD